MTLANTIYLGWHYVLDDIAGVVLGAMALAPAAALTGVDLRKGRGRRPSVLAPEAAYPPYAAALNGQDERRRRGRQHEPGERTSEEGARVAVGYEQRAEEPRLNDHHRARDESILAGEVL